jgi:hypothetical protein
VASRGRIAALSLVAACAGLAAMVTPATAYEFALRTRSFGQGYQLRGFRLGEGDILLDRRRYTQTLTLMIWDLTRAGDPGGRPAHADAPADGPDVYFTSYLRVDHDFGDYTTGAIARGDVGFDALDLVPELTDDALDLDLLYAYVGADRLLGGRLDLRLGRQLSVDTLDFFAMDGLSARIHTPWHLAVEAFAGLRVRDSSPLGTPAFEPDGTGSGECAEYVEGAVPFSGSWRPIDRSLAFVNGRFTSDLDSCPQREETMPTFGGAIETERTGPIWARVAYRRSVSQTVGVIGAVDRLDYPDRGLYPDEDGSLPGWGTNEERLAASLRASLVQRDRRGRVTAEASPYAALRYSLLHGIVDEAHAGVALRRGAHRLEPEIFYSVPTFDGDSIFNVFGAEPYTDARLRYQLAPDGAAWRGDALGWVRWFGEGALNEAASEIPDASGEADDGRVAGGGQLGGEWRGAGGDLLARLDLFHEDGYGGRRSGGWASLRARPHPDVGLGGRLGVVDFDDDGGGAVASALHATTLGAQAGATWIVEPGIALHLVVEETSSRLYTSQLRVLGVIDLAFRPEM